MTILVAEVGINHNGDFARLMALIDMALRNGADLVKMQVKTPELCVPKNEWENPKKWFDGEEITYLEYKKRMEFSDEQLINVRETYGEKVFASVWDTDSIRRYARIFGNRLVKVPSAKIVKKGLMVDAYNMFSHIVWSTGMSTERMVKQALGWVSLASTRPKRITVLDCHSAYPTPEDEVNLKRFIYVKELVSSFSYRNIMADVGYSSHSRDIHPPLYAAVLGAKMIEVHFTDDRSLPGTDQKASLDVRQFADLARELKNVKMYMNNSPRGIFIRDSELPSLRKLR